MKHSKHRHAVTRVITTLLVTVFAVNSHAQSKDPGEASGMQVIEMQARHAGIPLTLSFTEGPGLNHPTFAVWLEDANGEYLETLFVTRYFGTGIYGYADAQDGTWKDEPGESIRPAALPYWSHKRNVISRDSLYVPTPENPVPDALTGATPQGDFKILTSISESRGRQLKILFEINQAFDWNDHWTNNKYPDDANYKPSGQPSVIYAADIDRNETGRTYQLKPIGHGHYAGRDGALYPDLSTLTTALEIVGSITITLNQ